SPALFRAPVSNPSASSAEVEAETPSKGARISANRIDIRTMALYFLMSSLPAEIRTTAQLISPEHSWQPAYATEAVRRRHRSPGELGLSVASVTAVRNGDDLADAAGSMFATIGGRRDISRLRCVVRRTAWYDIVAESSYPPASVEDRVGFVAVLAD